MAVIDLPGTLGLPPGSPPQAYFGLYDGHNGEACSEMLARRLHGNLTRTEGFATDPAAALVRAFMATDASFLRRQVDTERQCRLAAEAAVEKGTAPATEFRFSGATAVAMLVRLETVPWRDARDDSTVSSSGGSGSSDEEVGGDSGVQLARAGAAAAVDSAQQSEMQQRHRPRRLGRSGDSGSDTVIVPRLYIAHCGDCRAVLSHAGVAVELTQDHKPSSRPDECARIAAAGGWIHNGRLHGVLAVSRAFGDAEHKTLKERFWETKFAADPLIVAPDVRVHTLRPRDEFLVLACDGVWDVMASQMVVNFVRRKLREHGDVQRAAEQLVAKALALHSADNISAFVIALHQY